MSWLITPSFSFDHDAAAYIAAVEAADTQALETNTRYAINNFVIGCKQDGIWSAIKASCILAGARTLTGALVPLTGTAPTNFNFVSGDYNRKTGLVGNGSTKYLNSNRSNSVDPQDSKHISLYFTTATSTGWYVAARAIGQSGNTSLDPGAGGRYGLNGPNTANTPGIPGNNTLLAVNRPSSSTMNLRVNKIEKTYEFTSTTSNPELLTIGARINTSTGVAEAFFNSRIAFYSIGESLDLALLDARVTDLINAFAAAIP